jgi:hypothetical protein
VRKSKSFVEELLEADVPTTLSDEIECKRRKINKRIYFHV